MLTEEYIFDALQAEKEGEKFPVEFDAVWESFGYERKADARRYLTTRSGLEPLYNNPSRQSALVYNQSKENNKIFLSVMAFKFALARAGTSKGEKYLLYLLEVEERYIANLNRLIESEANIKDTEISQLYVAIAELKAQLQQSQQNHLDFSYSARLLWKVSGIVSFSQVKNAIKRDFLEGRDWVQVDEEIFVNEPTYYILIVSFRSMKGTDISHLPNIIKLETNLYFQYQAQRQKNKRVAQEAPGQLALLGI